MNYKNTFLLLLGFFSFTRVDAQPLSAYSTFQKQFMVWDDGIIRRIESLVPLKVEIGRIAIPYIDNSRNFKIYHNGSSEKINDGFTRDFQATDNLVTFQNAKALWVWDQGKKTLLSNYCEQFFTGDSIVVYFDGVQKEFRAYYNGNLYPIEGFLAASNREDIFRSSGGVVSEGMLVASGQLPTVKVSDNIAAYVNYSDQFKILYRGEIRDQEDYLINNFDVGRNTVAYVDINNQFYIFHKGKTRLVSDFTPQNYAAGDDVVAFVDNDNSFKIFYNDSVSDLGYFQPDYIVRDNIVAFEDATGYFNVFYKGKVYKLENRFPEEWQAGYNSMAYVNSANELILFSEGEVYNVGSASVSNWRLDYDVVQYQFGQNMFKVFYKGRTY